jgi:hypothetical protein
MLLGMDCLLDGLHLGIQTPILFPSELELAS